MKKLNLFFLSLLVLATIPGCNKTSTEIKSENYTPDWESLSKHNEAPEWFQDAKFGIYFHWGLYSVPAFGSEWYPRTMHLRGSRDYKYHIETYGELSEFGYHDFVPMFKAEKFDATEWAQLFKDAGAKFAGPCAQHHDGFAMWDSEVNPWNAKDKGPKVDITGELEKEIRKQGLKLITTFHHARLLQRNVGQPNSEDFNYDSHYPYDSAFATSTTDPELMKLYGIMSKEEFNAYWFDQLKEVIDQYSPDIIWFDSWLNLIPENTRQEFCAYYLNHSKKLNKDVVIAYKQHDIDSRVGVLDIEQGGKRDVSESSWMTDVTLSTRSWCYIEGQQYKTADLVVRNMIDVFSKNGVILLNISPKSDGTIPQEQQGVLREIGTWFKEYGEAVYNTRAWKKFGFGTAKASDGAHGGQKATLQYTASDVRFTLAKDNKAIYLFLLGKPEVGATVSLNDFVKHRYPAPTPIENITLLNSDVKVQWSIDDKNGLLTIPDAVYNDIANVFKLELE